jgi:hypothetical protein
MQSTSAHGLSGGTPGATHAAASHLCFLEVLRRKIASSQANQNLGHLNTLAADSVLKKAVGIQNIPTSAVAYQVISNCQRHTPSPGRT